jgi:uncharacterized protein (UPF0335 family)
MQPEGSAVTDTGTGHNGQIVSLVERAERLEEEIKSLNTDKSELFKEAKSNGFDVAALKKIIALRRIDPTKRQEQEAILDLYKTAMGML